MVIMTLSPVVTAFFGFLLFDERLNLIQILGIFITISGIALIVLLDARTKVAKEEHDTKTKGFIYAILGSALQSLSFLLAKFALDETGPISTNLLRNLGGLACFIIFNFLYKRNAVQHFKVLSNRRYLLLLVMAAFAGPVLGMSSQMKAFTLAPVGIVTTITQVTPILLLPFDYFILHKRLTASSLAGTFLSIAGVAVLFLAA